jgi:hypothetical protein
MRKILALAAAWAPGGWQDVWLCHVPFTYFSQPEQPSVAPWCHHQGTVLSDDCALIHCVLHSPSSGARWSRDMNPLQGHGWQPKFVRATHERLNTLTCIKSSAAAEQTAYTVTAPRHHEGHSAAASPGCAEGEGCPGGAPLPPALPAFLTRGWFSPGGMTRPTMNSAQP